MFRNRINSTLNGIAINVYELDQSNQNAINTLEDYLTRKIKSMKIHRNLVVNGVLSVPTLQPDFVERLNTEIQVINAPAENKLNWFDVRRSRVTEFMSQALLEKEYQCSFFDEADKRINLEAYQVDKHAEGVDVTGIRDTDKDPKFVICEVKASKESRIPCSSAADLLKDISNAYTNGKRVLREIVNYFQNLKDNVEGHEMKRIFQFLIEILMKRSSHEIILKNVIFIPFLIRNNPKIIETGNLNDFRDFKQEDFTGTEIKGIIWAVNFDIDTFAIDLYNRALNND